MSIVKANDFNPEKVIIKQPTLNKRGTYTFYLEYEYDNGKVGPLRIQTGKMKTPFGISGSMEGVPVEVVSLETKDTIALSFEKEHEKFKESIELFDKKVLNVGIENARKFLDIDEDDSDAIISSTVKKAFYSSLKYSIDKTTKKKNDQFPPTIRGTVYKKSNGEYDTVFYDAVQAAKDQSSGIEPSPIKVNIDNYSHVCPKMSTLVVVMRCSSIWTSNKGFGLIWVPEHVKIWKSSNKLEGFSFLQDDDEEVQVLSETLEHTELEDDTLPTTIEQEDEDELDDLDKIVEAPPVVVKTSSRRKVKV